MTQRNARAATTTDAGIPVESDEHSLTVGSDGPVLLHDHYLIEQMANFNRERIPERQRTRRAAGRSGTSRSPATSAPIPRPRCSSPALAPTR
jgi:catalase